MHNLGIVGLFPSLKTLFNSIVLAIVVFTMMYSLTVDWRFPGQEDLCWEICSPYCLRETDFSLMKTEVGSPTR